MLTTQDILSRAVAVRSKMSLLTTEQKNEALLAAADALEQATADILIDDKNMILLGIYQVFLFC